MPSATDAFQLQNLEQRILLSADGLVDPAAAMPDETTCELGSFEQVTVESDTTLNVAAEGSEDLSNDQLQGEPESLLDGLTEVSLVDELSTNAIDEAAAEANGETESDPATATDSTTTISSSDLGTDLSTTAEDDLLATASSDSNTAITEELVETLNAANPPPADTALAGAPDLPYLALVDPDLSKLAGQVIYLYPGGAEDLLYDGPIRIENLDISPFTVPTQLAGQETAILNDVRDSLNQQFAGAEVSFTTNQPASGPYSTVYLGGDGSEFWDYGIFYGLAEAVDIGNTDRTDRAFIFTDNLTGLTGYSAADYVDRLSGYVAHETGRLLGYANDPAPTPAMLEANPLLAVAATPSVTVNLSQPLEYPSPDAPSAADTENDGTAGVSGEYDEEMIGEHIDFTITFDNTGTTEGYAPYIDFTAEAGITFARQVNQDTGRVTTAGDAAIFLGEEIGSSIQSLGKVIDVNVLIDQVQAAADAWLADRVADPIISNYLADYCIPDPPSYDFAVRVFDSGTPANVENFLFNAELSAAYQALVNLRDDGDVTTTTPVLGDVPDDTTDNTGDTAGADPPDLIPNQLQEYSFTTTDLLTPEGAPVASVSKFWVSPTTTVDATNFHNLNLQQLVQLRIEHPLTDELLFADGSPSGPGDGLTPGLAHNDIYYTMELPFGSYTPGQPVALIDFEARLAPEDGAEVFYNQDNATNDRDSFALSVRAMGGFRLGLDPIDNPNEDPLIAGLIDTDTVLLPRSWSWSRTVRKSSSSRAPPTPIFISSTLISRPVKRSMTS